MSGLVPTFFLRRSYGVSEVAKMLGIGRQAAHSRMRRGTLVPDRYAVMPDGRKQYFWDNPQKPAKGTDVDGEGP